MFPLNQCHTGQVTDEMARRMLCRSAAAIEIGPIDFAAADAELRRLLPVTREAIRRIQEAQRISPDTWHLRITI